MDFGELISRRQSQNIEDLRSNYTAEDILGGGKVYTFDNFMPDTTVPWQANTVREPLPGALGALTQSAKDYTRKKEIEEIIDALRLGMLMKQAREGTVPTMPPVPSK